MYQFIKTYFDPPCKFIGYAAKTTFIQWSLKSRSIMQVKGAIEFPEIFPNPELDYSVENHSIFEIIPKYNYNKIIKKTYAFFKKRLNTKKNFVINLAYNRESPNMNQKNGYLIYICITTGEDQAGIFITPTTAIAKLNDKVLTIFELLDGPTCQLVYASSLVKGSQINLVNSEYDILRLIAMGYDSDNIAHQKCLSTHTVNGYRKSLLDKFKAKNIFQLIYHAYQEGFI
jgi:DNA-binding CsgD family transcriptional regulator